MVKGTELQEDWPGGTASGHAVRLAQEGVSGWGVVLSAQGPALAPDQLGD